MIEVNLVTSILKLSKGIQCTHAIKNVSLYNKSDNLLIQDFNIHIFTYILLIKSVILYMIMQIHHGTIIEHQVKIKLTTTVITNETKLQTTTL